MPIAYDPSPEALFRPESRATVFGADAPPDIEALAVEAARLAYLRFEADPAELARLASDIAKVGFGAPAAFHDAHTGSQGFGALRDDGLALLAFRGTQADQLDDLLTDIAFLKVPWPQVGGQAHHGFARAAGALWPQVKAWLDSAGAARSQLLVCGHSLGAAIATLLAVPAGATRLVTIGSPRVGDADFVSAFTRAAVPNVRIVDFQDAVTRLPPSGFPFHYRHLGGGLLVDADGRRIDDPPLGTIDDDIDLAEAARLAVKLLAGGELPRELTDHAPVNYLRAFWP